MKRFELNFNEDKINDVLDKDGASYNLKECCKLLNDQQADLNYLAKFIGEFKVEEFKLKLRNLRTLEDKVLEQQDTINKKKELLKLIANACSFSKEHTVKEILRNEIKGIDTVTYESANAYQDYVLLSEFFKECYGEYWDND